MSGYVYIVVDADKVPVMFEYTREAARQTKRAFEREPLGDKLPYKILKVDLYNTKVVR